MEFILGLPHKNIIKDVKIKKSEGLNMLKKDIFIGVEINDKTKKRYANCFVILYVSFLIDVLDSSIFFDVLY